MRADTFTVRADDQKELFVHRFRREPAGSLEGTPPRAIVHIAHGMAEHGARYARFAEALVAAGYIVYANDHRGHGKTASSPSELGWFGPDGFRRCVDDLAQIIAHEKAENPGLPTVLFGHSMGSYLTQAYIIERGRELAGAILSGTSGKPSAIASAGRIVARIERARVGARGRSKLLGALSFEAFNKAFAPNRTAFDWLSRDEAEVDKYIADPLCGFPVSTQLWVDLLDALARISRPAQQARVPRDLPIHVLGGCEDPVGERTKSVDELLDAYERAGVADVTHRYYPGARHETLNETNRDDVTHNLIAWLDDRIDALTRLPDGVTA
jgi:alpha-beta hydrolase superfamily lysophospholipase